MNWEVKRNMLNIHEDSWKGEAWSWILKSLLHDELRYIGVSSVAQCAWCDTFSFIYAAQTHPKKPVKASCGCSWCKQNNETSTPTWTDSISFGAVWSGKHLQRDLQLLQKFIFSCIEERNGSLCWCAKHHVRISSIKVSENRERFSFLLHGKQHV